MVSITVSQHNRYARSKYFSSVFRKVMNILKMYHVLKCDGFVLFFPFRVSGIT